MSDNLPARRARARTDKERIQEVLRERLLIGEIDMSEFADLMDAVAAEPDDYFSTPGTDEPRTTLDRWKPEVGLKALPTEQVLRKEAAGDAGLITGVVVLSTLGIVATGALLVWWFIVATLSFLITIAAVSAVSVLYLTTYAVLMRNRHANIETLYGRVPNPPKIRSNRKAPAA